MSNVITGKVIQVLDGLEIVINKGAYDGVKYANRFLVYKLGDELFDPDTKESLGILEIVCGEGKPVHIQEHLTTLHTARQKQRQAKTVVKKGGFLSPETEEIYDPEQYDVPFENVGTDCIVRQIR